MDTVRSPWMLFPGDVGSPIKAGPTFIQSIQWHKYEDPEHQARILDGYGRDVFNARGVIDFQPVKVETGCLPFDDLKLDRLDSGFIQIFIK